MRCAFLTLDDPTGYIIDDHLAVGPLARLGWSVEDVPWRRRGVDWSAFDAVVIRSTWDYAKDPDDFLDVLTEIARSGVPLFNPLDLVTWNIHKTYLRDLAGLGVAIAPTVWRERLGRAELHDLLDETGWQEMVVKPVVGASARGAFRVTTATSAHVVAEVEAFYRDRALMAQPFVRAIPTEGEYSLFYFNGEHSHTILKTPRPADFRVQEEHGGAIVAVKATPELRAAGARVLRALDETPLYARVDLVRANDASGYWLMELELIEPSLYLRTNADAPARFANALHQRAIATTDVVR